MFIIGCLGPALALDRMGRRKTMFFGGRTYYFSVDDFRLTWWNSTVLGLGFCMMMASILLSFGKKNTSSAAVAFFFLYMLIFGG